MPLIMKLSQSLQHRAELAYVSLVIVSPNNAEMKDGNGQKKKKAERFHFALFL